jgi:hypothetical protein
MAVAPEALRFISRTSVASIESCRLPSPGGDALKLALATEIRFEFGEDARHVEEALPGRGARVDRLFRRLSEVPRAFI